ncbi:MAG: hypothetical protein ACP5HZ_00950 [Ferrimicrobium sp.]|uniref:hypothetical protein n=1 Tax=Ferrimicrobium sp. TaxID=2926050 RepID=UPI00261993F1|nr:hypothetical protein [Ferrimicrobium sp.]
MALLEHFRYLARYAMFDDPDIVTEFGYLLAEGADDPVELSPALVQLLKGMPKAVEIWSVTNSLLGAVDLASAAAELGWALIAHISGCELHRSPIMPLAVSAQSALQIGALQECCTCRFRLLPDVLLHRYATHYGYHVEALGSRPVYVDGVRVLAKQYEWPNLAPILADH